MHLYAQLESMWRLCFFPHNTELLRNTIDIKVNILKFQPPSENYTIRIYFSTCETKHARQEKKQQQINKMFYVTVAVN